MVCTTHKGDSLNEWVKEQVIGRCGFSTSISLLVNGLSPRKFGIALHSTAQNIGDLWLFPGAFRSVLVFQVM